MLPPSNLPSKTARRVVNAKFSKLQRSSDLLGTIVSPGHGLVMGEEYALLVDVGPQWNELFSIVEGSAVFPEVALPVADDPNGWLVQVVFVSEEFSPSMSSAEVWVPRKTGRSFPVINGERAREAGPVSLTVRAPLLPPGVNKNF